MSKEQISDSSAASRKSLTVFAGAVVLITGLFGIPLSELFRYSLSNDLYSHAILMPLASFALVILAVKFDWHLESSEVGPSALPRWVAGLTLFLGVCSLISYFKWGSEWSENRFETYLSALIFGYVMLVWSSAIALLDRRTLGVISFALGLLVFMVPFPVFARDGIELFFQHTSAEASYWLFKLFQTPIYREALILQLPGITLEVAPQCSGIRSSLVLFIVSVVASRMFLNSGWRRVVLVAFVIPLAIFRNALRIFTIGQLCVVYDPSMIDSAIHHKGGPLFFAISLIPFFVLLYLLIRNQRKESV